LSSVSVVLNSLRLRGLDVRPGHVRELRRGPVGVVRDGAFLVVVALLGLALATTVVAADRAVSVWLPTISVTASNVRFSPPDVTVRAGEWTQLRFTNADPVVHDWMVEAIPNLDTVARPGQTSTLRFVLDTPGRYAIECSIPGHAEAGMVGTLTVLPRD
jgi:uncharacterized cupredoxin-like copper-binding protein